MILIVYGWCYRIILFRIWTRNYFKHELNNSWFIIFKFLSYDAMFIDFTQIENQLLVMVETVYIFSQRKIRTKRWSRWWRWWPWRKCIFKANTNLHTLQDIRYKKNIRPRSGSAGGGSSKTGRSGKDIIIPSSSWLCCKKENERKL